MFSFRVVEDRQGWAIATLESQGVRYGVGFAPTGLVAVVTQVDPITVRSDYTPWETKKGISCVCVGGKPQ